MFKKIYKSENDDIKTNRELIDKIFETAEKGPVVKPRYQFYRYGVAVAAVFVFSVTAFMYPHLVKLNEQPQIPVEQKQETLHHETTPKSEDYEDSQTENVAKEPMPMVSGTGVQSENRAEIDNVNQDYGIEIASENDEIQNFSIPEGPESRMIEGENVETKTFAFEDLVEVTEEEKATVETFLKETFGEKDEHTENLYIFEVVGRSDEMFLCRWRHWVIDHSSVLTELVISEDFTEVYECIYTEDGFVQWNTSNNMIEK